MENTQKGHFYPFKIVAAVALIMAAVMFTGTPLGTLVHAENGKYVKDMVMISAQNEKRAAEIAAGRGYTFIKDPIYVSPDKKNGQNTYIAVTTTNNGAEAITDMCAMNMNGGWSYDAYKDYLTQLQNETKTTVSNAMLAVKELREGCQNDKPVANFVREVLNRFYDGDIGKSAKFGDILVSDNLTDSMLFKYYLQGNKDVISALQQLLFVACTEGQTVNFLENMKNIDFDTFDASEYAAEANSLYQTLKLTQEAVNFFLNSKVKLGDEGVSEEDVGEYLKTFEDDPRPSDEEVEKGALAYTGDYKREMYISGYMMTDLLKKYEYHGNPDGKAHYNTVYDLIMSNYDELDPLELAPLVAGMTAGQRALCDIGLTKMIQIVTTDMESVEEYFYQALNEQGLNSESEGVSIYAGVNRTVFNPDGIAMTDSAMRAVAKDNDPSWTETEYDSKTKSEIKFCKGFMIAAAASVPLTAIIIVARVCIFLIKMAVNAGASNIFAYFTVSTFAILKSSLPTLFMSLFVVTGLAIGAILLGIAIMELIKKEAKQIPKWKQIPKIMCSKEKINSKDTYIYYDAVRNLNSNSPTDVGNWESETNDRQWMALYISHEKRAGKPILSNSFAVSKKTPKAGVSSLRKFGGSGSLNVASYSLCESPAYIIYKPDTKYVASKASSVFSKASSWGFAAAGLAIGLVGGTLIGTTLKRKKQDTPEQ